MSVFKFRVALEQDDTIYRDIEILPTHTFLDFFNIIMTAFGFDGKHDASFYRSNDNWIKGAEISLNKKENALLMHKVLIGQFIEDPHQKIYFVYDPVNDWCFYIELKNMLGLADKASYPRITKTEGIAPKQYGNTPLGTSNNEVFEEKLAYDENEEVMGELGEDGEGAEGEEGANDEDEFGSEFADDSNFPIED